MRRRWIAGGLAERIEVTNYSASAQRISLDLELDADAADIFEVRGRVRERRGTYRPTEATPESLVFAYEGLDGLVRRTLVSFTPAEVARAPARAMACRARAPCGSAGPSTSQPGGRGGRALGGLDRPAPDAGHARPAEETPTRLARSVTSRLTTAAPARRRRRAQPRSPSPPSPRRSTAPGTSAAPESGRTASSWTSRSAGASPTCACSGTTGRCTASTTSPPASRGSRRSSGATASSPRSRCCRSCRTWRARRSRVLADWQATEDDPERDMEPGKILHELRVGELARTGELPHRPYYGSDRLDAAVAHPPRRDVSLDGRPRARPIALAERARRARVDRPVRRSRRRRVRRVRAPDAGRAC